MKQLIVCISLSLLLNACHGQKGLEKQYINTSKKLVDLIHKRDSLAILEMIIGNGAKENKRGDVLRNDLHVINEYLDSISNLKTISYNLSIDKNNLINYAIVTIPLRNNNDEVSKIEVFFSNPEINPPGRIRNFNFNKEPKSFKFNSHPKIGE